MQELRGEVRKLFMHFPPLKCTKFDFGWGSAGGAYSAPPDSLAGFKGPTSKGRDGRGW